MLKNNENLVKQIIDFIEMIDSGEIKIYEGCNTFIGDVAFFDSMDDAKKFVYKLSEHLPSKFSGLIKLEKQGWLRFKYVVYLRMISKEETNE